MNSKYLVDICGTYHRSLNPQLMISLENLWSVVAVVGLAVENVII